MALVRHCPSFADSKKEEFITDLRAYGAEYEDNYWKATGRIAKLGLPRGVVKWLRRWNVQGKKAPTSTSQK
jgi:hypothetical protein